MNKILCVCCRDLCAVGTVPQALDGVSSYGHVLSICGLFLLTPQNVRDLLLYRNACSRLIFWYIWYSIWSPTLYIYEKINYLAGLRSPTRKRCWLLNIMQSLLRTRSWTIFLFIEAWRVCHPAVKEVSKEASFHAWVVGRSQPRQITQVCWRWERTLTPTPVISWDRHQLAALVCESWTCINLFQVDTTVIIIL